MNLQHNWGNVVVLVHAPGLYSLMAHLSPGTLRVHEGQTVIRGQVLASCGSSGRSPRPHLHLQLQASPHVGAPTLHLELHDVVAREDPASPEVLHGAVTPPSGATVRNVEPQADVAARLALRPGDEQRWQVGDRLERVVAEVGLLGELSLRSCERRATLTWGASERLFTVYAVRGSRRSVLWLLGAALPRVPFEVTAGLTVRDHLPLRHLLPRGARLVHDVLSPFLPQRLGLAMTYELTREGDVLVFAGRSARRKGGGEPWVTTRVEIGREGPIALELRVGRRRYAARRIPAGGDESASQAEGGRAAA